MTSQGVLEGPNVTHRRDVDATPAEVWAVLRRAADAWGAEWEPGSLRRVGTGRLRLPVTAGIRFGVLDGELKVEPAATGGGTSEGTSEVSYRPDSSLYFVNTKIVAILLIAALGGLLVVAWPFFPDSRGLSQVAPLGAVLALVGWFLVISRLENRGPAEFLELVAMESEASGSEAGEPGASVPEVEGPEET